VSTDFSKRLSPAALALKKEGEGGDRDRKRKNRENHLNYRENGGDAEGDFCSVCAGTEEKSLVEKKKESKRKIKRLISLATGPAPWPRGKTGREDPSAEQSGGKGKWNGKEGKKKGTGR